MLEEDPALVAIVLAIENEENRQAALLGSLEMLRKRQADLEARLICLKSGISPARQRRPSDGMRSGEAAAGTPAAPGGCPADAAPAGCLAVQRRRGDQPAHQAGRRRRGRHHHRGFPVRRLG
jgi:hypothetical protein